MIEDSVQTPMKDAPFTRRRRAAARRATLRVAAVDDDIGQGVREDGAQLMRSARPASRMMAGAGDDRMAAGDDGDSGCAELRGGEMPGGMVADEAVADDVAADDGVAGAVVAMVVWR